MSENSNNLLRITQMNAIYLDKEIYNVLYEIFVNSTKHLSPGFLALYESEIKLILRLLILQYSIVQNGSTFGQQLLCIKYKDISSVKKVLYVVGSCLEFIKTKLEVWKPLHEVNNVIYKADMFLKLLNFINISVFLRNGSKPLLIERLLGLDQVYSAENVERQFNSKYLARELLWNGFIELFVFILPLINYHKIRRVVKRFNPIYKRTYRELVYERNMTMHTKCGYCGENPILPHHMGCPHIFCYYCLKGNQTADEGFECPICGHKNIILVCQRV